MEIKQITVLFFVAILSFGCSKTVKTQEKEVVVYHCPMQCEGEKTYNEEGVCPICNMDLKRVNEKVELSPNHNKISETSIFNLTSKWNTEEGEVVELKDLKGKTLVLSLIHI